MSPRQLSELEQINSAHLQAWPCPRTLQPYLGTYHLVHSGTFRCRARHRAAPRRHSSARRVHHAPSPHTRRLVVEHGGFRYDSDYYGDDLPFWSQVGTTDGRHVPHLVVPYTLDANDMRFASPQGFNTAQHFFDYLRDSFDVLYAEGEESPKMMSIGMHCRLLGRPGRFAALQRFLDHIERHDRVWVARRIDIADHWIAHHPFVASAG